MSLATFSCPIAHISEDPSYNVDIIQFEDTSEQRALSGDIPTNIWTVETDTLTTAEKDTIRAFFLARKGSFEAFNWVSPLDNLTYKVRFVPKTFKISDVDSINWKISFNLQRITS
jgi:phage-related protein